MTRESFDKMVTMAGFTPSDEEWKVFSESPRFHQVEFILELAAALQPARCTCNCQCDKCDSDEEV